MTKYLEKIMSTGDEQKDDKTSLADTDIFRCPPGHLTELMNELDDLIELTKVKNEED